MHKLCEFCKYCRRNTVMQFKLLNEKVLSTGEPCTCEYVTIATFKNLPNMAVLEERLNKTDIEKVG